MSYYNAMMHRANSTEPRVAGTLQSGHSIALRNRAVCAKKIYLHLCVNGRENFAQTLAVGIEY